MATGHHHESVLLDDDRLLTAAEAAARLGVKRETLYAYVSRGVLERTVSIDGRTSLFDPAAVDRLRRDRRRSAKGEVAAIITSSICRLDEGGHAYRGRAAADLVAADVDFEDVTDLLWGTQPSGPPDAAADRWQPDPAASTQIRALQTALPDDTPGLDRLRLAVSALSAADPLRSDTSAHGVATTGRRILCGMATAFPPSHLGRRDRLADQLWSSLADAPGSDEARRALNATLVLLADHGLATSTFAVRLAASTRADTYSMVAAGLGALGGVMHGTASDQVHALLATAEAVGAETALGRELAADRTVPGVGHVVYADRDRREAVLFEQLQSAWGGDPRLDLVLELRRLISDRIAAPANVDLGLGALTWLAGMRPDAGGVIFAVARTSGWLAHGLEELQEEPLRFRPVARYVGPD